MKYNLTGTYIGALTLSTSILLIQGIAWLNDGFYISSDSGDQVYRVEYDGTVSSNSLFNSSVTGNHEGLGVGRWPVTGTNLSPADGSFSRRMCPSLTYSGKSVRSDAVVPAGIVSVYVAVGVGGTGVPLESPTKAKFLIDSPITN